MDIAEDLSLNFQEQCFIQITRLREELKKERFRTDEEKKLSKHRLYRYNMYEDISPEIKHRLKKVLCYNLKCLGEHLKNNLVAATRGNRSNLSTPTPVRDLSLSNPSISSSPLASRIRSPNQYLRRTRSTSVSSEILRPIKEVIIVSSDEEEIDEDQEIYIKVEKEDSDVHSARCAGVPNGQQLHDITNTTINQNGFTSSNSNPTQSENISDSLLVVDLRYPGNFFHDDQGVVHLKSRKQIKFRSRGILGKSIMLHVLAKVVKLIESNTFMTKRALFYHSKAFCAYKKKRSTAPSCSQSNSNQGTQAFSQPMSQMFTQSQTGSQLNSNAQKFSPNRLDCALNEICCLLGCSKTHLHILTQPKGLVFGELKFTLKTGETHDCFSDVKGTLLPNAEVPISSIECDAKFILLIEKDSIFQRIINLDHSNFVKTYKALLITGKGYPDSNTRAFVNFLWSKLKIPVLALTDADPHGLEIACCYKFGTYTNAHESLYLSVPQIRWLGILPTDIESFAIPESKTQPLTEIDQKKIRSLLSRPYIAKRSSWVRQLEFMLDINRKAQMEALDSDGEYLIKTYLPNKLRYASWLK